MKKEQFEQAMTDIDDRFVEEAATANLKAEKTAAAENTAKKGGFFSFVSRHTGWVVAACLCICVVAFYLLGSGMGASKEAMDTADGYYAEGMTEAGMEVVWDEVSGEKNGSAPNYGYSSATAITPAGSPLITADTKIIYTADISAQSETFETAMADIEKAVADAGGYFETKSIYQPSDGYHNAELTIRVPAANFDALLGGISSSCNVIKSAVDADNISEEYYDTKGRLESAQAKLSRMQELLAQAENMEDIITIEEAINEAQYEVDHFSGVLKNYDSRVEYSTVRVTLMEVYKETEVKAPKTFWDRISEAFSDGIDNFIWGLEDFAEWLAYSWTGILVFTVIVVAIVLIVKKIRRKKK